MSINDRLTNYGHTLIADRHVHAILALHRAGSRGTARAGWRRNVVNTCG